MRRLLYVFTALLLFVAVDAFAQCQRCEWEGDCATCAHTYYNASQECEINNNGYGCTLIGGCAGALGECLRCVQQKVEARPFQPTLRGEWRLVSVELSRPAPQRKRRS